MKLGLITVPQYYSIKVLQCNPAEWISHSPQVCSLGSASGSNSVWTSAGRFQLVRRHRPRLCQVTSCTSAVWTGHTGLCWSAQSDFWFYRYFSCLKDPQPVVCNFLLHTDLAPRLTLSTLFYSPIFFFYSNSSFPPPLFFSVTFLLSSPRFLLLPIPSSYLPVSQLCFFVPLLSLCLIHLSSFPPRMLPSSPLPPSSSLPSLRPSSLSFSTVPKEKHEYGNVPVGLPDCRPLQVHAPVWTQTQRRTHIPLDAHSFPT